MKIRKKNKLTWNRLLPLSNGLIFFRVGSRELNYFLSRFNRWETTSYNKFYRLQINTYNSWTWMDPSCLYFKILGRHPFWSASTSGSHSHPQSTQHRLLCRPLCDDRDPIPEKEHNTSNTHFCLFHDNVVPIFSILRWRIFRFETWTAFPNILNPILPPSYPSSTRI